MSENSIKIPMKLANTHLSDVLQIIQLRVMRNFRVNKTSTLSKPIFNINSV